jgi:hypothetical protein
VSIVVLRWSTLAFVVGTLAALLTGCLFPVGYDAGGGVGAVYYEPSGAEYGGWGPGYHVALETRVRIPSPDTINGAPCVQKSPPAVGRRGREKTAARDGSSRRS